MYLQVKFELFESKFQGDNDGFNKINNSILFMKIYPCERTDLPMFVFLL